MSLTFSPTDGQYYKGKTAVLRSVVLDQLDKIIEKAGREVDKLTELLRAGTIDLATWQTRMGGIITVAHMTCANLGVGGFKMLDKEIQLATELQVRHQLDLLNRYATKIEVGASPIHKGWARQYAKSARTSFFNAELHRLQQSDRSVIIHWIRTAKESCPGCIEASKQSYYASDCPEIGSHQCGANCKCYLVYEQVRPTKIDKLPATPPLAPPKPFMQKKTPAEIEAYLKQQMQMRLEQAKLRLQKLANEKAGALPPTPPTPPSVPASPIVPPAPPSVPQSTVGEKILFNKRNSNAFTERSGKMIEAYKETVNKIHGDGGLLEVLTAPTEYMERYEGYVGKYFDLDRIIEFDSTIHIDQQFLTVAHEFGHSIDFQSYALAGGEKMFQPDPLSELAIDAAYKNTFKHGHIVKAMDGLMAEIRKSPEWVQLTSVFNRGGSNGHFAQYLLNESELFARAYTQYIAEESGQPRLLTQLSRSTFFRNGNKVDHTIPMQWQPSNFGPIKEKMQDFLRSLGWEVYATKTGR